MKSLTRLQLLQASSSALVTLTLLHNFLSNTPFTLILDILATNLIVTLSCAWCLLISLIYYFSTRPPPIYLLNYSCYKPGLDRKVSYKIAEFILHRSERFTQKSEDFMRGIYAKSGLGDETYGPPSMFRSVDMDVTLRSALEEAEEGMFSSVDALFAKTKVEPSQIDVVIATCSMFTPIPSLTSMLVNRYKLNPNVKTFNLSGMGCSSGVTSVDLAAKVLRGSTQPRYALVVITENISLNWYFGEDRSMLVTNCIFRVGCAAAIVTNDPSQSKKAKLELIDSLRSHHGSNDSAYRAAFQQEDEKGNVGVALTKDLIRVAGMGLREHIRILAPRVLPVSQLVLYAYSLVLSVLSGGDTKPRVPDFTTAFDHLCVHTGGKAVIVQVGRVLNLDEYTTEPARMSLHRFGNTSSSLVFYQLAYFEAKGRVKKGDKIWMLAFGTGFKVGSLVLRALHNSHKEVDNPWNDCMNVYPVKTW